MAEAPLSIITEGDPELLIDPEVALKACQEVLHSHDLRQKADGDGPDISADISPAPSSESPAPSPESPAPSTESPTSSTAGPAPSSVARLHKPRPKDVSSNQQSSWLLRLFESKLFDVSMAISYLYSSKDPGVQAYIGNRLFSFPDTEVDFFLPQLLNMYVHMDAHVGDAIKPYLVSRCRASVPFSLTCAWLLGAYSSDMHLSTQTHSRGSRLRKLILSDELHPGARARGARSAHVTEPRSVHVGTRRTHQRSKSDATVSLTVTPSSSLKRTSSNPRVESPEQDSESGSESPTETGSESVPVSPGVFWEMEANQSILGLSNHSHRDFGFKPIRSWLQAGTKPGPNQV